MSQCTGSKDKLKITSYLVTGMLYSLFSHMLYKHVINCILHLRCIFNKYIPRLASVLCSYSCSLFNNFLLPVSVIFIIRLLVIAVFVVTVNVFT